MTKTITAPAKLNKKEQLATDQKRAAELADVYGKLMNELGDMVQEVDAIIAPAKKVYTETTAPVFEKYQPKLDTLKASIKAAEEELKRIGERQQKTMFDTKGNWRFENGAYIHIKHTTIAVTGPGFSLAKFKKKFGDLIEVNFKISELKKLFTDGDSRKQSGIEKYDIDLKPVKSFEVKMKAQTNDEQEN